MAPLLIPTGLVAVILALAWQTPSAAGAEKGRRVKVSAGAYDRTGTIVPFALPESLTPGPMRLRPQGNADDAGAAPLPVQTDGRRAWFVLDALKAGQTRTYRLEPVAPPAADGGAAALKVVREGNQVTFSVGEHTLLRYQGDKDNVPPDFDPAYARGGYLHPIYTPAGKLLSDDYPPNHKHHHGVWSPWTKTEFEGRHPDFWNMGEKTGRVEFVSLGAAWGGGVCAGFEAKHRFVDLTARPDPKTALEETWAVVVYRPAGANPGYVFDLTITQSALQAPLLLPKYHYGGLGFRGNRQWDGAGNARFLTSQGRTLADGNETRGRWCRVGGLVDGAEAGLAVLGHPDNFCAPQPMRLHPSEPFFCYAPSQEGDWKIEPGKPYVARYRFVAADGAADARELDRQWDDYATPPTVVVSDGD